MEGSPYPHLYPDHIHLGAGASTPVELPPAPAVASSQADQSLSPAVNIITVASKPQRLRFASNSAASPANTLARECEVCKRERAARALVAAGDADPRFVEEKFDKATAIFPNNDVKYDVNKTRAALYAAKHGLEQRRW